MKLMTCKCGYTSSAEGHPAQCKKCNEYTKVTEPPQPEKEVFAFPTAPGQFDSATGKHADSHTGMTLRDWFAGMALQGAIAGRQADMDKNQYAENTAELCYQYADEMMKARKK